MICTVTLSPALDYVMKFGTWRTGGLNRSLAARWRAGGKGVNVSRVLRRLGGDSLCLGFAAGFTGDELLRRLRAEGLREAFVRLPSGETRVNVKLKTASETECNADGPAPGEAELEALRARLSGLGAGDTAAISGSAPGGMGTETLARLASAVRSPAALALDLPGEALAALIPLGPFLVKPNMAELSALAGRPLSGLRETAAFAASLVARGVRYALVSRGADGAILASPRGCLCCRAPQGGIVDTTGAGDSMLAGFLLAHGRGDDDGEALRFAVACGTASARSEDLLTPEALSETLAETERPEAL